MVNLRKERLGKGTGDNGTDLGELDDPEPTFGPYERWLLSESFFRKKKQEKWEEAYQVSDSNTNCRTRVSNSHPTATADLFSLTPDAGTPCHFFTHRRIWEGSIPSARASGGSLA